MEMDERFIPNVILETHLKEDCYDVFQVLNYSLTFKKVGSLGFVFLKPNRTDSVVLQMETNKEDSEVHKLLDPSTGISVLSL